MEINVLDILLLFILAIAVSLIIGFNVIYVVDKKMSDIKINIPTCPVPNFFIKTDNGQFQKINVETLPSMNSRANDGLLTYKKNLGSNSSMEGFASISYTKNNDISATFTQAKINNLPSLSPKPNILPYNVNNELYNKNLIPKPKANPIPIILSQHQPLPSSLPKQNISSYVQNINAIPTSNYIVQNNVEACNQDHEIGLNTVRNLSPNGTTITKCVPSVIKNNFNEFKTGFVTADGNEIYQDISFYVPKLYMGPFPSMQQENYMNM